MGSIHPHAQAKYDGVTRAGMDLADERWAIYVRSGGYCATCGMPCSLSEGEIAHRIANTVAARKRYGAHIIDSIHNKAWTHRGRCNSAQNCFHNPGQCAEIVKMVEATR